MTVSKETLDILRSVRTSDVSDALDSMGLQQRFVMDPAMRPLYPGVHFAGIAHTAEYDIVHEPLSQMSYEEFDARQYEPGPDGLHTPPKGLWVLGLHDEMRMIALEGVVHQAEVPSLASLSEGALQLAHEPHAAQRGHLGPQLQGDVAGMARAEALARAMQDARVGGGLAPGSGPPSTAP